MKKARCLVDIGPLYYCRQRPTLPHSFPCSTIDGIRLNFRVRNGNGCDPDPMTTGKLACLAEARFASEGGQNIQRTSLERSSAILDNSIFCKRPFFQSTMHAVVHKKYGQASR